VLRVGVDLAETEGEDNAEIGAKAPYLGSTGLDFLADLITERLNVF
jgi:hypothetical protein